jgi:amino acid transporter
MAAAPQLRRALTLRDLIFYGIIIIQPTAPMPIYGVVSQEARGHVVTTVLIAMVAMLFTAISYGRMARAYPSSGSAYTYVSAEIHPTLGYLTGWSLMMDYLLNPVICAIWCAKAAGNFVPSIPYFLWAPFFALLFTMVNLRGIEVSAKINQWLAIAMGAVVAVMFFYSARYLAVHPADWLRPFYDPATFSFAAVSSGTAIAVLTYIGFDGISTLSEEAHDPKRNILRATVITCLITGVLASAEVYVAQLIWPDFRHYPDVDTAYVFVAGRAGGPMLFALVNLTLLVATVGSGVGSQLAAARMLFGMGRDNAIPRSFFAAIDEATHIPRNNVLLSGALALVGTFAMSYRLGAELLNFGAFIAFMGVNAASLMRYWVRARQRDWSNLLVPVAGFAVCFYIWINLGWPAKIAGTIWLLVGLAYRLRSQPHNGGQPRSSGAERPS